jgi:hypothetical protein
MIIQDAELSLIDFKNSVEFIIKVLQEEYKPGHKITADELACILDSIIGDLP